VTIDDPNFLSLCNEVYRISREQIAEERSYRQKLRSERQQQSRPRLALNTTEKGGSAPPAPPVLSFPSTARQEQRETLYL
jgi:hypothetical protein